jgi:hypothetical protein
MTETFVLLPGGVKHEDIVEISLEDIEVNPWNPNEVPAEIFNMLAEDIQNASRGFLQPPLVGPLRMEGDRLIWRIVDGEHRFHAARMADRETIKCVVIDPELMPESEQKKQTVRMNRLRGKLNIKKFVKLVHEVSAETGTPLEDLGVDFGFQDDEEFQKLIRTARESLPDEEAKEEFDRVRAEIKTVDDLSLVLNSLFTRYGNSLNANFMILDFGGKKHLWVRMRDKRGFNTVREKAIEVLNRGYTFDSFISAVMEKVEVDGACGAWADELAPVVDPNAEASRLDDLFSDEDEE